MTWSRSPVVTAILVALLAAAVFLPTVGSDFVNWDDPEMIVFNPGVRGSGWAQLHYAFTSTWFSHYHPLTWLSFQLDHALWGLNPAGYHLTNVILHALATACVFLLARALLRCARPDRGLASDVGAVVAALAFALHPLRVEPVAWVTARRDVLSGVLVFGTVVVYLRAVTGVRGGAGVTHALDGGPRNGPPYPPTADNRESPPWAPTADDRSRPGFSRAWFIAAVLLFLAALLSKSIAMGLPVILLVLDWYPLRRLGRRGVWLEKVPFFVLGGAGALVALWAATPGEFTGEGPVQRLAMTAYSLAFYLWKTVLPIGLTPIYEAPADLDPLEWRFVAGAATTVAITALAIALRRRWPPLMAGWLAYAVTILPVSGLVHAGHQLVYLRYSYLGGAVIAVLIGGVAVGVMTAWRTRRLRTPLAAGASVVVLAVLIGWSMLTAREIRAWRDSDALWTRAIAVEPGCALCRNNLGSYYVMLGRPADAELEFRRALALRPSYDLAAWNLASVLRTRGVARHAAGDYASAVRLFAEATSLVPGNAELEQRLASAQAAERARAGSPSR